MVMREQDRPFMGRAEYDILAARTEADFSFVRQVDELFTQSGETSMGRVRYRADQDGLLGETTVVLEEYNPVAAANDETTIDITYWTDDGPADGNYAIRIASLPQRDQLSEASDPIVTSYDIQSYGGQYFGYVQHAHINEGNEMTPYDYRQLGDILDIALAVRLAERRERAIIGE